MNIARLLAIRRLDIWHDNSRVECTVGSVGRMPIAAHVLRSFAFGDDPGGKGLRSRVIASVGSSDFSIEYIVDDSKGGDSARRKADSFGLFLRPNATARRMYGLDREVLLWCTTYPDFQARDLERMQKEVERHGTRLSRQFAILVTKYEPNTRSRLESEATLDQTIVHTSFAELSNQTLRDILARTLFSRDLFNVSGATTRAADFFGRRELIDRVVSEVQTGTAQIGVFGLRKVGKTSLLNRLGDRLQNSGSCNVARLDLQWTVAINPRPEYSLWALGEAIYASHRSVRYVQGYRLLGQLKSFSDLDRPELIWEYFAHDLQLLLSSTKRKICILIDEIERMFEAPAERGFVRFWRLMRGLDQQNPGRLRYVIGGTSPQCAEKGVVDGEDNPLFRYLSLEFLGPLTDTEAVGLLNSLATPMGLAFDPTALDWARRVCGGHPALLRTLGSTVHRHFVERTDVIRLGESQVRELENSITRDGASVIDQMLAALQDQYADEYFMLGLLADGQVHQYRDYAAELPLEDEHLRRYGLVSGDSTPTLTIGLLQRHMNRPERPGRNGAEHRTLSPGAAIGPWAVVECVSAGAYGVVYRVTADDAQAAVKVLPAGKLSMLQREVEVLRDLRHPGIVAVRDALQTDDGLPCLLMEFLEGPTLATYCTPTSRPSTSTARKWVLDTLRALTYMHPKAEEVQRLEQKESLTSSDLAEWDRARHGYVHRDIKPENILIVDGRGAVLVDFNISIRAGSPVLTTSATPGYLPPTGAVWEPSVDLYALGVTVLELLAGARLATCTMADLFELAQASAGVDHVKAASQLLAAPETGLTASEAERLFASLQ